MHENGIHRVMDDADRHFLSCIVLLVDVYHMDQSTLAVHDCLERNSIDKVLLETRAPKFYAHRRHAIQLLFQLYLNK